MTAQITSDDEMSNSGGVSPEALRIGFRKILHSPKGNKSVVNTIIGQDKVATIPCLRPLSRQLHLGARCGIGGKRLARERYKQPLMAFNDGR